MPLLPAARPQTPALPIAAGGHCSLMSNTQTTLVKLHCHTVEGVSFFRNSRCPSGEASRLPVTTTETRNSSPS